MAGTSRMPFADDSDTDDISLTSTDEEGEFPAETILCEVPTSDAHVFNYLVKWEGWQVQAATIEPLENLEGCAELLNDWEADKAKIRAGTKQPFNLNTWFVINEEYKVEQSKRKARRAKKREKAGLFASASALDHVPGSLFLTQDDHPDSEADEPAPRKRQKISPVKSPIRRGGVAQPVKKGLEQRTAASSSNDDSEESSSDDPLISKVNEKAKKRPRDAMPDRSTKQGTAITKAATAGFPVASKPAPEVTKNRKISQSEVSHAEASRATAVRKPIIDSAATVKSTMPLNASAVSTEPQKKSYAKRTANAQPVNIFSNWTDPKAKRKQTTRVNGETPKDSAEPKFTKLSIQQKYQRYSVNEPAPNPDALGTFNPVTGRLEPAKGPAAAPKGPVAAATAAVAQLTAPVRRNTVPLPAQQPSLEPPVQQAPRDRDRSVQVPAADNSVPTQRTAPAAPMRIPEAAKPTRQVSPPAPRPKDLQSVFGRRSPPPKEREKTPTPPAPEIREAVPQNAYTKTCTRWKAGRCDFGTSCYFAHTDNPRGDRRPAVAGQNAVPSIGEKHRIECLYWNRGHCDKTEDACQFAHHVTGFYVEYVRSNKVMVRSNGQTSHGQQFTETREGNGHPSSDGEIFEDDVTVGHLGSTESRGRAGADAPPPPPPAMPAFYDGDRVMCHFWRTFGTCKNGSNCKFAHHDTGFYLEAPGSKVVLQTAKASAPRSEELQNILTAPVPPPPHTTEPATSEDVIMGNDDYTMNDTAALPANTSMAEYVASQDVLLSIRTQGKDVVDLNTRFAFTTPQDGTMFAEVTRSQKKMELTKMINAAALYRYLKDTLQQGARWPTGSLVADGASASVLAKFGEACRLHASCGVVFAQEYTILVFPSGVEEWNLLSQTGNPVSHALLQFKILPALPAQPQASVNSKAKPLSIRSKDFSTDLVGRQLLGVNVDKMLVTSDGKIDRVFIMMPLSREAEIVVLTKLFEAKGCKVSSNRKAGEWDVFRRLHHKRFLLLVHPEVPLRNITRLGLIISSGYVRAFSVGVHIHPADESHAPRYECRVLFPHGEVVLIPDDMFYFEPAKVAEMLKKVVTINSGKPGNADQATRVKIATRPNIREWLHQLVLDKHDPRGRPDARWLDQFQALCELYNDSTQVPGEPLASSDVIEAPLPGYQDLPLTEQTELLVAWFGTWSEHYATDYRRFSVPNYKVAGQEIDPQAWGTTYSHMIVVTAEDWLDRQRKLINAKK